MNRVIKIEKLRVCRNLRNFIEERKLAKDPVSDLTMDIYLKMYENLKGGNTDVDDNDTN